MSMGISVAQYTSSSTLYSQYMDWALIFVFMNSILLRYL